MARRTRAYLLMMAVLAIGTPVSGQISQDSLRRLTAEEYHALRRQWLEARRAGLVAPPPVTYGSAVVGAPGRPVPGPGVSGPAFAPPRGPGYPGCGTRESPDRQARIRSGETGRAGRAEGVVTGTPDGWPDPNCPLGRGAGPFPRGSAGPFGPGGVPSGYGGYGYGGVPGAGIDPFGYYPGQSGYGYGGYGHGQVPGYGPGYGAGSGPGGYGNGYGWGWPADPFNPAPPGWNSWTGVTEYGWGLWGPVPVLPYGWRSSPGEGYGFAWPGVQAGECVVVVVTAAGGQRHTIAVGLQALGLTALSDLDLAIDQRLSQGQAVTLPGIDGRILRLTPGMPIEDIRVTPCAGR